MLVVASHLTGGSASGATPSACGPRHWGQLVGDTGSAAVARNAYIGRSAIASRTIAVNPRTYRTSPIQLINRRPVFGLGNAFAAILGRLQPRGLGDLHLTNRRF